MFCKEITNSSEFLMMSPSAQALYLHIGMNADDDGFCEIFPIMRMTDSKPDDLNALHGRGFIYCVDSKVCIVKDWHTNNQMRRDRYKQSRYLKENKFAEIYAVIMKEKIENIDEYKTLLSQWQPNGNQRLPQDSIGKDSIGKDNIVLESGDKSPSQKAQEFFNTEPDYQDIADKLNAPVDIIKREIQKFIAYWTEPNATGKKQRWQMEKTFEISRRLNTWFSNTKIINQEKKGIVL